MSKVSLYSADTLNINETAQIKAKWGKLFEICHFRTLLQDTTPTGHMNMKKKISRGTRPFVENNLD